MTLAAVPLRAAPYAAMVMDARTGEVLHARNADTRLHPASLTKMMTLYVAFEAIRLGEITLDTQVRISQHAASEPPSRLGLRAGSTIRFRYLIRAAAIRSGNDAATAIAEAVSGSEAAFARRMNRTARALGMARTTFRNAHGLTEEGHLSTAHDMTIMGRRLFYDYPEYYNIFSRREEDAGIARIRNTNRAVLDAYRGADGIKTGYTRAAGFNLVASAERGNVRIIATVFGGQSAAWRNQRIMELLDLGFAQAPSRATERRPSLPVYDNDGDPDGPVGQITRPSGLVSRSIRPVQRPGASPALVASAPPTPELLQAIEQAVGEALSTAPSVAADGTGTLSAVAPAPRPETIVAAVPDAEPQAEAATEETAPPVVEAEAVLEVAEAEAVAEVLEATEVAETILEVVPEPRPEDSAAVVEVASAAPAVIPAPTAAADPQAVEQVAVLAVPPRPADAPAAPAQPTGPEIVTRASSSGERLYGVTLGPQPSHHAAERLLLRTALSEVTSFEQSLRRVVQRNGGYEPRFQGMTEDQAARACARLSARGIPCETFGPAS
ncbi:D-alanyl-D-alanine carboxypeptidase [Roseicyclus marinus]|nr:D-alanyl-D-alanine carboxypeptidase family protein [Roseicyclus marinus]MDG3041629.1 D-alanyl-D-alanine carboxypeptidase [Roseicyclus marinus]